LAVREPVGRPDGRSMTIAQLAITSVRGRALKWAGQQRLPAYYRFARAGVRGA